VLVAATSVLVAGYDVSTNKATGLRDVAPVVLTLANWQTGDSDVGEWIRAVEWRSEGIIRIEVRGGWRRGEPQPDRGVLEDVREGRVDLGHIPTRAWDTLGVDAFRALHAPLLIDSLALQERVLRDDLGASMLAAIRTTGVEPVALNPGPLRRPLGVTRDLRAPSDFRGATIGAPPSRMHEDLFRTLGARVTAMPPDSGLADLDGTERDLASIDQDELERDARSVTTDVVLWPRPTTLVMNRDRWKRLSGPQRRALTEAADDTIAAGTERERTLERGATQSLCDRDFRFVRSGPANLAALREAVEPVYRALAQERFARTALARIRELKKGNPLDPTPVCPSGAAVAPGRVTTPLVGRWGVEVTRAELAAAPLLPGEEAEPNAGRHTLVLAEDGNFQLVHDRSPTTPGTWSASGDVLAIVPGGTLEQGAGETWQYRWTVFRDTLTLSRLTVGPTALTLAPLRRR